MVLEIKSYRMCMRRKLMQGSRMPIVKALLCVEICGTSLKQVDLASDLGCSRFSTAMRSSSNRSP